MYFFSNSPCKVTQAKGISVLIIAHVDRASDRCRANSRSSAVCSRSGVSQFFGVLTAARLVPQGERELTRLTKVVFPVPPSPTVCAEGRERASPG